MVRAPKVGYHRKLRFECWDSDVGDEDDDDDFLGRFDIDLTPEILNSEPRSALFPFERIQSLRFVCGSRPESPR